MALKSPEFVNYNDFMTKGLPPHDSLMYPELLGNRTWRVLHGLADHYGCETCRPAFKTLISGIHDTVSILKLEKDPYNTPQFWKFVDMVNEAAMKVASRHDGKVPIERDYSGRVFIGDEAFRKVLPVTPLNVLKAADHYTGEYGSSASVSDLQFLLSIPHGSRVDKAIDNALEKAPAAQVRATAGKLVENGLLKVVEGGGYLLTEEGRRTVLGKNAIGDKAFNSEKTLNSTESSSMKGSEIGLIVGSELAAKGTEILATMADRQLGVQSAPLHQKPSTWVPLVGALLVFAGYKVKYFKKSGERQLATVAFASHLLSQGVDLAQTATTPGVQFALVQVPPAASGTPGWLPGATGGVGMRRDLF